MLRKTRTHTRVVVGKRHKQKRTNVRRVSLASGIVRLLIPYIIQPRIYIPYITSTTSNIHTLHYLPENPVLGAARQPRAILPKFLKTMLKS